MSQHHADDAEIEALEETAAWRLRLHDADPANPSHASAARLLERLAGELRGKDCEAAWIELGALLNWLGESDAISDYAALAAAYRRRVGVTADPTTGVDYLRELLAIAGSLV